MTSRFVSLAACLAFAAPAALLAQDEAPEDGEINLDSIDALLGGSVVTEPEDDRDDSAEEAGVADGDDDGPTPDEDAAESDPADEAEAEATDEEDEKSDESEVSDLTVAFNAYSLCASEAGAALEEEGFAVDQIANEALLRCGGERAAYVNAFYFDLLPRYPDTPEGQIRSTAENLVQQSDAALMNLVTAEVRELRDARPDEPEDTPAEDASSDDEEEETNTDA